MKKLFLFLAVMVGFLTSCDKEDKIFINIEYTPCKFSAPFQADIETSPMTRLGTETPRLITCYFPAANGEKSFTVEEGTTFTVELPTHETSKGYFVYASGQTIGVNKQVEAINESIFDAQWEGKPIKGKTEEIVLRRSVGKVTIIKGDIPVGYTVKATDGYGVRYYKWYDNTYADIQKLYYSNNTITDKASYVSFPTNEPTTVTVILLNANNSIVTSKTVEYTVQRNVNINITVNSSAFTEDGFHITIDDTPMTNEDINVDLR